MIYNDFFKGARLSGTPFGCPLYLTASYTLTNYLETLACDLGCFPLDL